MGSDNVDAKRWLSALSDASSAARFDALRWFRSHTAEVRDLRPFIAEILRLIEEPEAELRAETFRALHAVAHEIDDERLLSAMSLGCRDSNPDVRFEAARLFEFGGPRPGGKLNALASRLLVPLLDDPSWLVRHQAAASVDCADDPRAREGLLKLLSDPDDLVRMGAAIGLRNLRLPETRGRMVKALRSEPSSDVRALLEEALREIPESEESV